MTTKKKKQVSCLAFNKFITQFIDKYNWGWINDDGEPSFRYTSEHIKSVPYKSFVKLRTYLRTFHINRTTCLKYHLRARDNSDNFVFYTNRIGSDIIMLCGDIDCVEGGTYLDCLEALLYIRERFHNNCYFEPSTSSSGIHFYIFIDFSTGGFDSYQRDNCNFLIKQYSEALSILINSEYNCIFDGFKGTYRTGWNLETRGTLGKLPCPQNKDEFSTLCNSPILSCEDIKKNWEDIKELNGEGQKEQQDTHRFLSITSMSTAFVSQTNEKGSKSADAFERSRHICQKYCRDYYKIHKILPTLEEFRKYYRNHPSATGDETKIAISRLKDVYKFVIKAFNEELCIREPIYKVGEFIEHIKNNITEEQIKSIIKTTSYKFNLTYEELDVGLGYFYKNLMSKKEHKTFCNKELTVPINDMCSWFRGLKQAEQISHGCNRSKVQAIKAVLEHIGYIECVDRCYSTGLKTSRRWAFTPKFPKYQEFVAYVGQDVIDMVRKSGQEYLEYKNRVSKKHIA
mgnify:CR=1 FL=1